jgi:hypothetical protein
LGEEWKRVNFSLTLSIAVLVMGRAAIQIIAGGGVPLSIAE